MCSSRSPRGPRVARGRTSSCSTPRLHQKVVPSVLALAAPRIVYVSCNPESAGRDLAALSAGGYRVRRIRPVDLFPHTPHVETVITLDRASGGAT